MRSSLALEMPLLEPESEQEDIVNYEVSKTGTTAWLNRVAHSIARMLIEFVQ